MQLKVPDFPNFSTPISPNYPLKDKMRNLDTFFNHEFEEHLDRFDWFKNKLPKWSRRELVTFANFGCHTGRESFAMTTILHPLALTHGIDNDCSLILDALRISWIIEEFRLYLPYYTDKVISSWWKTDWQDVWKYFKIPIFHHSDISNHEGIILKDDKKLGNSFIDLVYSRCVLWKIEDRHNCINAIRNMATIIKPNDGRIVLVEPTINEGKHHNLQEYFLTVKPNLEILYTANDKELCKPDELEYKDSEMKGYILKRV